MDIIRPVIISIGQSAFFRVLLVLVVMDTIFGCLRAIKERVFNSTIGINGLIRKAGMLLSLIFMVYLDQLIHFNLIGFIPEAVREYLPAETIGITEFFAVLYIIYEILSVLKNMSLAGLPVQKIWTVSERFLKENTGEIMDSEDLPEDEKTHDIVYKREE